MSEANGGEKRVEAKMSEEQVTRFFSDIAEIKATIKDLDRDMRHSLAALPCSEMMQRVARNEQRLDNSGKNKASSRAWIAIVAGWFLTIVGLVAALVVAYKK